VSKYVRRHVIERVGIIHQVRPFEGEQMVMVDASDHEHYATDVISLTRYCNEEPKSTKTDLFIIDSGPYDMLLGEEFVKENLDKLLGEQLA
jgi:hypothetical protein